MFNLITWQFLFALLFPFDEEVFPLIGRALYGTLADAFSPWWRPKCSLSLSRRELAYSH